MPSQPIQSSPTAQDQNKQAPLVQRVREIAEREIARKAQAPEEVQVKLQQELDLFDANLLNYNLKDDMATMEAPLYSLSTNPDMDTWKWISPDKKKWLEVTPSSIGRATIHDKDLLIYLTSQLVAGMNDSARNGTKMPGRRIRFKARDFLIATGRDTGGKSYTSLESTIDRLSGTRLKTNIEIGNIDCRSSFGLIEQADYVIKSGSNGSKRMISIEVSLSEWLYRALQQKKILTINPLYFTLRKPLAKRLYQLARKHVGDQPEWIIKEDNLLEKASSKANIGEFRRILKAIMDDDNIPDYRIEKYKSRRGENMVGFYKRSAAKIIQAYAKEAQPKKVASPQRMLQADIFG